MTKKDKLNAVVLYDVIEEIKDDTNTDSIVLDKILQTMDILTSDYMNPAEMEGLRDSETYYNLFDSMYKELSKLA